ncbi:hypothetical protein JW823_07095 [bacterium]|nr:hypothetical protein [candidate division CSSED10-310 bacterium]
MKRILVLTGDRVGIRMAGPAIRAFEMSRCLSRYHNVTMSCPELDGSIPDLPKNMELCPFGVEPVWQSLKSFDAAIIPASMHVDAHFDTPLLVDLYDPFILSSLARSDKPEAKQTEELHSLMRNLERGDFFVCASDRQRDFWIGMLAAAGRVNMRQFRENPHLHTLIQPAPFGIDNRKPSPGTDGLPGSKHDAWIVWAGGIWDWFDPLTPIEAVSNLNKNGRAVSLFFMGTGHPNPLMTQMSMVQQAFEHADRLGLLNKHVFFGDWIPYAERGSILSQAQMGISTHYPHLETRFSYRTRILDYIWSRLPFICTDGDYFADLAEQHHIGLTVPPENVNCLVDAINRMLDDALFYRACKDNLESVAHSMTWEKVLAPILEFCDNPHRSSDCERPRVLSGETQEIFCSGCETATAAAGEILATGLIQEFPVPKGGMRRIDVKLATYNRLNTGYGIFELIDSHRRTIVTIPFDLAAVTDNHWFQFRFGPIPARPGSLWRVRITCPVSRPGNAITVWVDETQQDLDYELNGVRKKGHINFRVFTCEFPGSDQDINWRKHWFPRMPWNRKP